MVPIFLAMLVMILLVIIFNNTSGLVMIPTTSPEAFLSSIPHIPLTIFGKTLTLIEPNSTILVYLLVLIMVGLGIGFLSTKNNNKGRRYWGIGLILWGLGAITAGTSYQAFGYELKCHERDLCQFTTSFELVYMLLTAYSINFLVAATGYISVGEVGQKRLLRFSIIDSLAYSFFLLIGAVIPIRFMVSYEGFMVFMIGNFILMFILNIRHYKIYRDRLNYSLIWLWIGFLIVNIGYFVALFVGFAEPLFTKFGIWFNENDILHTLLILWAGQIYFSLWKTLSPLSPYTAIWFYSSGIVIINLKKITSFCTYPKWWVD